MTNRKTTKRALWSSVLSLLLCFAMLLGTTYAWFTDSVTSANNIIKSGNLDVEVYTEDGVSIEEVERLFADVDLWEPGAIAYENLTVANLGTLALKYRMTVNFTEATETAEGSGKTLVDVLKVAVVSGGFNGTREDAQNLSYNYSLKDFALDGKLDAKDGENDEHTYGIVIYWEPTENDNDYNVKDGLSIKLGINLFATQWTSESDAFGSDYDVLAPLPEIPGLSEGANAVGSVMDDGSASMDVDVAPSANINKTIIDAPAGTFDPSDRVEVSVKTTNSLFNVNADGAVVAALDVTITVNGEKAADLTDGKLYTVTTYISKGLENVSVAYTGTDGAQPTFVSYDAVTGKLVFTTNHFSNYAVSGKALAYDTVNDVALVSVEKVVEAVTAENSTIVIPEASMEAIQNAIDELPAEKQDAAIAATAAAKIGETTYATLADAFEAAAGGATIVLLNNVNLDAETTLKVASGESVVLNLNGKTIIGTDTTTASYGLITVGAGATLTINDEDGTGAIVLSAIHNNGWSRYSSVISNQAGTLIVNGGTIKHLGGTDMAYGIDNLTGSKPAKTVINGGSIESTYIGIRQFCNAVAQLNEVEINGGAVIGTKRSVWMQQPNSNTNLAKLTINDGTLKGALVIGADNFTVVIAGGIFTDLQTALNYAVDGAVIGLADDFTGDVTVAQQPNVKIVVDGMGNKFNGIITVDGKSGTYTTAALTIKNVNFKAESISADACINLGKSGDNNTRYTCNVTVENCTFDVPGAVGVKSYTGGDKNVTISGCTALASAHSLCQLKGVDGVLVKNCEIYSKNGMNFNNSDNVVVDGCIAEVKGYTVRFGESNGGSGAAETYTIKNSTLTTDDSEGDAAVILRGTADNATLTIESTTITGATKIANTATNAKVYVDGVAVVFDAASLDAALKNGGNAVLGTSLSFNSSATTANSGYGATGVSVTGGVLDGNGNKLGISNWGTWDAAVHTTGGTIKNLTINSGMRGIFMGSATADVYVENVTINGTIYTFNSDGGSKNFGVYISNSTLNGWTSHSDVHKEVVYTDCEFGEGNGYAFCRPYGPTQFVGCNFAEGFEIDSIGATTFENCTINGVPLTADNLATLVTGNTANASIK